MARPSKLGPAQWAEIERRLPAEGASALGREFGISEAGIRKKFGSNQTISSSSAKVREVAQKLADAQDALADLPVRQQYIATSLAEKLRNIGASLAGAAEYGAATSHRLAEIANAQVQRIDDADPMESQDVLQAISALTKISNDASQLGVSLINAAKSRPGDATDKPRGLAGKSVEQLRDRVKRLGLV